MKAAYIEHTGAPDNIIIGELPTPELGAHQVLVKVQAASVNPIDTYIRSGAYSIPLPKPYIIGRDMIGVVVKIGAAVASFKTGQTVWCNNQGYAGRQGTFCEFIAVDENLLYQMPEGADPLTALASAHSGLTSVVALMGKAKLRNGETIFINGGSGNVGTCGVQLAKAIGAKVIVTAGSEVKTRRCYESGADKVINYKTENVQTAVREFAPDGVDVCWDLTQAPDLEKALNVAGHRCRMLLCSGLKSIATFSIGSFYTRNCTLFGFTVTDLDTSELATCAQIMNTELKRGTFKPYIEKTLPLTEAAQAHELQESGKCQGKILVTIS